jgi:hypothetical protein
MVTPEAATKAKERALTQGVQVWVLEPGRRYVALSRTQEGLAYEISLMVGERVIFRVPAPERLIGASACIQKGGKRWWSHRIGKSGNSWCRES